MGVVCDGSDTSNASGLDWTVLATLYITLSCSRMMQDSQMHPTPEDKAWLQHKCGRQIAPMVKE